MAIAQQDMSGLARLDQAMASASGSRLKGDPTVDGRDAPWVEKYRPKTLDDVAAHKEIIETSKCITRRFSCTHVTHAPRPKVSITALGA